MKIRGNTVGTTMSPERIGDRIGGAGGSEYELIRTINITEEGILQLTVDVDNDGNPFALDKCVIYLKIACDGKEGWETGQQLYIGHSRHYDWIAASSGITSSKTANGYYRFNIDHTAGYWFADIRGNTIAPNDTTPEWFTFGSSGKMESNIRSSKSLSDTLTCLTFHRGNGTFQLNSTIEIWGVKK